MSKANGFLEINASMRSIKELDSARRVAWCLLFIAIAMTVFTVTKWVGNDYLWFDESGQFFMAKGLNHYSAPYSTEGSVASSINENRFYNLDPGGFTLLLRGWTNVSNDVVWLRMLPLLFYLIAIVATYKTLAFYVIDKLWRTIITFGLLGLNIVALLLAPMIRAYSMEVCGSMLTLWWLHYLESQNRRSRLFLMSVLMSIFCTSRYGFVVFAFGVALYVLWWIFRHNELRSAIGKAMAFALPLLSTVAAIYFFETRFQNANASCPTYLSTLFSRPVFLFIYPLSWIVYGALACIVIQYKKTQGLPLLYKIMVIEILLFMGLSISNAYPWNMQRAISLMLPAMMIIGVAAYEKLKRYKYADVACASVLLVSSCAVSFAPWVQQYPQLKVTQGEEVAELIEYMRSHKQSTAFVEAVYAPDIRFLYEYGALKQCAEADGYPQRFVFQNGDPCNEADANSIVGPFFDETTCDVMIHANFQATFNKRDTSLSVKRSEDYELVPKYQHLWRKKMLNCDSLTVQ